MSRIVQVVQLSEDEWKKLVSDAAEAGAQKALANHNFVTQDHFDQKFAAVEEDISQIKEDIAQMKQDFATKDDLKDFATKDDLKDFATKDDLEQMRIDIMKECATKDDLEQMQKSIVQDVGRMVLNSPVLDDKIDKKVRERLHHAAVT